MRGVTELPQPIEAWATRHWPVLTAFVYALSLAVLFGGTALAAYHSDVANGTAVLLYGAAAILFAKLYARIVPRIQRLIDALRPPKPDKAAKSDGIPLWAVVIYAMLGLAFAFAIADPVSSSIHAAIEFFVAWLAGCCTLNYLWRRRINPERPTALDVIDRWLDEQAAPHWPKLRRAGYMLSCALLFGGVALHAFQSGLARTAVVQCGSVCAAPGFVYLVAALCGVAAILFVIFYAAIAETAQLAFVDSWKHVRPGPPPQEVARWASVLYALIGLAVFVAIAAFAEASAVHEQTGHTFMTLEGPARDGFRVTLGGHALLELLLGWWIGGVALLKFFWLRRRATR
jgi:uncharacterized membrane protein YuzA (DUF378 family)